jgi:hypothetical protein
MQAEKHAELQENRVTKRVPASISRSRQLMVRRGSPVRVRKRALQSPAKRGFFFWGHLRDPQHAVGMEPLPVVGRGGQGSFVI